MPKINLTAEPSSYQEHVNSIDAAEASTEFSVRQQRMYLDERPFFSKNQLDVAVSRAVAKQFGWVMLAFVLGLVVAYLLCHIK